MTRVAQRRLNRPAELGSVPEEGQEHGRSLFFALITIWVAWFGYLAIGRWNNFSVSVLAASLTPPNVFAKTYHRD